LTLKTGEQIQGYYPIVIDEVTYQAVKALRKQSSSKGGSTSTHPLVGLVKHSCGQTMRRVNKGDGYPVFTCIHCRMSIPMRKAIGIFHDALFQSQYVQAPTDLGAQTLTIDQDIDGLALEIEDAFASWRANKSLATKTSYEKLLGEYSELKRKLQDTKTTNTEVLASLEERLIHNAKGNVKVFKQVFTSVSVNHELSEWQFRMISGKSFVLSIFSVDNKHVFVLQ
jgi:hypothetical protein